MKSSPVKYTASSLVGAGVDNLVYYLLFSLTGTVPAQIVARVISSLLNFNLNKFWVFGSADNYWRDFLKYYGLCIPQLLVTVILLKLVLSIFSVSAPLLATALKLVVELIIFCISYVNQKKWVFRGKRDGAESENSENI